MTMRPATRCCLSEALLRFGVWLLRFGVWLLRPVVYRVADFLQMAITIPPAARVRGGTGFTRLNRRISSSSGNSAGFAFAQPRPIF